VSRCGRVKARISFCPRPSAAPPPSPGRHLTARHTHLPARLLAPPNTVSPPLQSVAARSARITLCGCNAAAEAAANRRSAPPPPASQSLAACSIAYLATVVVAQLLRCSAAAGGPAARSLQVGGGASSGAASACRRAAAAAQAAMHIVLKVARFSVCAVGSISSSCGALPAQQRAAARGSASRRAAAWERLLLLPTLEGRHQHCCLPVTAVAGPHCHRTSCKSHARARRPPRLLRVGAGLSSGCSTDTRSSNGTRVQVCAPGRGPALQLCQPAGQKASTALTAALAWHQQLKQRWRAQRLARPLTGLLQQGSAWVPVQPCPQPWQPLAVPGCLPPAQAVAAWSAGSWWARRQQAQCSSSEGAGLNVPTPA